VSMGCLSRRVEIESKERLQRGNADDDDDHPQPGART
jgi:hypothetical protein